MRLFVLGLAALAALPAPLVAQLVTGRVVDAATAAPISGAVVRLLTAGGSPGSLLLTDSTGAFRVRGPAGRDIRLQAQMLGYESWTSEPMTPAAGETVALTIRLRPLAIPLAGLRAESGSRCRRAADLPPVTDALWGQVRAALSAERAAQAAGSLRFQVETFERDVAADSAVVLRETRRRTTTRDPEAFRSVTIRQLEESGFFDARPDGDYLLGPTASVLLDDWFTDTHCLSLVSSRDGAVGIRFQPNADRRQPEIQGTAWMNPLTLRLRRVEYEYVRLPGRLPAGARGGTIVFDTVRGGGIIIARWSIRSPIVQLSDVVVFGERRPVERTVAHLETGGEVLRALRAADTVYRAPRGAVVGVVFDSVNRSFIEGAAITLDGTGYGARSDSLGRYRIDDVPAGTYRLTYAHARLDAFGYRPAPVRLEVKVDSTAVVDLGIPRHARVLVSPHERARLDSVAVVSRFLGLNTAGLGPGGGGVQLSAAPDNRPARLIGRVVDHESLAAVPDAEIRIIPLASEGSAAPLTIRSDANGHFQLRGLPAGEYEVVVARPLFDPSHANRVIIEPAHEYHWVIRLRRSPPR